ncbi:MAG: hypothetical protein AABY75_05640 [Bacteroidota bacterium]
MSESDRATDRWLGLDCQHEFAWVARSPGSIPPGADLVCRKCGRRVGFYDGGLTRRDGASKL